MSRIEQIKAEQKKLADELEGEMLKERANVLAKMKEDIKLFGFKTSDFKGLLPTQKTPFPYICPLDAFRHKSLPKNNLP